MKLPELVLCAEETTAKKRLYNKENKMATWTDINGQEFTHNDDKLGFTAWIGTDPILASDWETASAEHAVWQAANPDAPPTAATGAAASIFQRWFVYANTV